MAENCSKITLGSNWVIALNPTRTRGEPADLYRDTRVSVSSPCQPISGSDNRYVVYISGEGFQFLGPCNFTITYVDCNTTPGTYDCFNGKCIKNTAGNGFYPSYQDCTNQCGLPACPPGQHCVDPKTFCPPGFVCLEDAEYQQIVAQIDDLERMLS